MDKANAAAGSPLTSGYFAINIHQLLDNLHSEYSINGK